MPMGSHDNAHTEPPLWLAIVALPVTLPIGLFFWAWFKITKLAITPQARK